MAESRAEDRTRDRAVKAPEDDAPRRRRAFVTRISLVGIVLGGLFCATTFTPSLIPRPWGAQGVLAGCALATGYGVGTALGGIWRFLEAPLPNIRQHRVLVWILLAAMVVLLTVSLLYARDWQNETLVLMGLPEAEDGFFLRILALGGVVAAVLILLGWGLVAGLRMAARYPLRFAPRRFLSLFGVLLFLVLLLTTLNDTVISGAISFIDEVQMAADVSDPPGVRPPEEAGRSGSPESLIAWDDLGHAGKLFVHEGPDAAEIARLTGRPAQEPIRVYAGLRSADDNRARAELVLEELKRTGAFERSVLVIATPTGTGWLDDAGIAPLEYLHGGDTAVAGVQYSYLASPQSLILEPGRAQGSASEVFDVIYGYWSALAPDSRPRLYLFGLSLGSYGSESSPMMYAYVRNPISGAVWAGPTFRNALWRRIIENRDDGSPAWAPVFETGTLIRVLSPGGRIDRSPDSWGPLRIAYVANPSDAIVFFREDMWLYRPAWMDDPRGPDVSPLLRWVPVVTFLQVAMDMLLAASVPPGHGHTYAARDYLQAWRAVTQPEDWTDQDTDGLIRHMAGR
ncbi:alpha/beta-hydrolase family protein [Sulfitobacter sp. D35]|uniref:alpha/beta hydrolase n=1 Tax=Sulfitobacter sp. D35 TaxID=3083252 RepID=UPI00296E8EFB|nr:alpha/beta-hydrolase family protein [Sulfitobacter sp. D35]MDW4498963.1 alpha/beta-hydrolase family protein [Sulfitobacter sp. D35]